MAFPSERCFPVAPGAHSHLRGSPAGGAETSCSFRSSLNSGCRSARCGLPLLFPLSPFLYRWFVFDKPLSDCRKTSPRVPRRIPHRVSRPAQTLAGRKSSGRMRRTGITERSSENENDGHREVHHVGRPQAQGSAARPATCAASIFRGLLMATNRMRFTSSLGGSTPPPRAPEWRLRRRDPAPSSAQARQPVPAGCWAGPRRKKKKKKRENHQSRWLDKARACFERGRGRGPVFHDARLSRPLV